MTWKGQRTKTHVSHRLICFKVQGHYKSPRLRGNWLHPRLSQKAQRDTAVPSRAGTLCTIEQFESDALWNIQPVHYADHCGGCVSNPGRTLFTSDDSGISENQHQWPSSDALQRHFFIPGDCTFSALEMINFLCHSPDIRLLISVGVGLFTEYQIFTTVILKCQVIFPAHQMVTVDFSADMRL